MDWLFSRTCEFLQEGTRTFWGPGVGGCRARASSPFDPGEASPLTSTSGGCFAAGAVRGAPTLAGELMAQVPMGGKPLTRRDVLIRGEGGESREVASSNLPALNDNQLDGAAGFKLRLGSLALVGNVIVPLNDGGLRCDALWTFGLQGGF